MKTGVKEGIKTTVILLVLLSVITVIAFCLRNVHDSYVYSTYPLKYQAEVEAAAEKYGVDKYLIYAVIKTESNFDPEAVSHAGAIGLMQLMPKTFEWMQAYYVSEDYQSYTVEDLTRPGINIDYGTNVLHVLLNMYGDEDTALCAYNAGLGNVDKWLEDPSYSADGKTFVKVPIAETENYRHLVAQNKSCYLKLYENQ